jgi:hypothetical protein
MVMDNNESVIAKLNEQKAMLVGFILAVEDWAFGEGYFLTPTLKAKLEIVRKTAAEQCSYNPEPTPEEKKLRARGAKGWTPEARAAHAERCRQRMLAYHAERRKQRANV